MHDRQIILIAHNIRSAHNVGSLFRTADGIGVTKLHLSGYTPHPKLPKDTRLPHEYESATKQINKTALGAIDTIDWTYTESLQDVIGTVRKSGFIVCGLEQSPKSILINKWQPEDKVAVLIGNEVDGIDPMFQDSCDYLVEIPMFGTKESFNVVQATAMMLYRLRFLP